MEITNGSDIVKSKNANILIYSKPGDGKTTLAGLLPGKTLVFGIDHTTQVLSGYENVDVANINGDNVHDSMIGFYGYAKANIHKYDNIFLDNITHYQKLWLLNKAEKTKSGMPEMKDYALFDNHILRIFESFNALDANVIFTAWETVRNIVEQDNNQYSQFIPDIREKIVNHIMGIEHVVARLIKKADSTRGFILQGDQSTFAKNHLSSATWCMQDNLMESLSRENKKDD